MDKVFLTVLNMSLTGAFVIVAIIIARLPLKKAPKIISHCLWAVAGFRLVFPFSIESIFSLMPINSQPIPSDIAMQAVPRIDSGLPLLNNAVSSILPTATPAANVNPLQIWMTVGAYAWLIGTVAMLFYGIVSYALLKRRMRTAIRVEGNICETDNIQSPSVLGIVKPKIYLPLSLADDEREYIILHERTHIRRHDHIVKFAAYFILCLHWFNPLAWVAFLLMGVDMEMSCDERVLKEMGGETKHDYSRSLLSLATQRRVIGGSPLAFGEGGVKERVKNVLNFRKPSRVIVLAAVALVAVLIVGFAVNRVSKSNEKFDVPYFSAGNLTLGYYIDDMEMSQWNTSDVSEWDYKNQYGAFSVTDEGRIDKFTLYVHAFTEGIWTMSGIQPSDRYVDNYVFNVPAYIENIIERFGEGSERYDAPDNSKNDWSYVRYEDKQTGINVRVDFHKGSGQIVYITAEGLPPAASRPTPAPTSINYEPRKWLDYYNPRGDGPIHYDRSLELELPEFPDTVFSWTAYEVKAIDASGEHVLFTGMPIWNVYLADLSGDGLPELCATVSIGSGIIDTRIIIYDYANDMGYDLSDRMYYDYALSMEDGRLIVTQTGYWTHSGRAVTGSMSIVDGELVLHGIDRTCPEMEPRETTLPASTDLEAAISQAILNENKNGYNPGDFSAEAHTTLTVVE